MHTVELKMMGSCGLSVHLAVASFICQPMTDCTSSPPSCVSVMRWHV